MVENVFYPNWNSFGYFRLEITVYIFLCAFLTILRQMVIACYISFEHNVVFSLPLSPD